MIVRQSSASRMLGQTVPQLQKPTWTNNRDRSHSSADDNEPAVYSNKLLSDQVGNEISTDRTEAKCYLEAKLFMSFFQLYYKLTLGISVV